MILENTLTELGWMIEDLTWSLFQRDRVQKQAKPHPLFTIGISTFMDRFDNCLKPLVSKLAVMFPAAQIIVIANGHVKQKEQAVYLQEIGRFCGQFANVELVTYTESKGLSTLWNQIVLCSRHQKILMLNDDIRVKASFCEMISNSGILGEEIATINGSWSNYIISRTLHEKVGPFDEGLLEIGGEDDDYLARLSLCGLLLSDYSADSIAGKLKLRHKRLTVNSYGKNMDEETNGYSCYNNRYLADKWQMSTEPFDGATVVPNKAMKYWKLKEPARKGAQ